MVSVEIPSFVKNEKAGRWVREMAALCKPDSVYWCDGSQEEYDRMCETMVDAGTFTPAQPGEAAEQLPGRSDPGDVARVEDRTFICSVTQERCRARPTTGWIRRR